MTAMSALKSELKRVQQAMEKYVDDNGTVYPCHRYRYQALTKEATHIKGCIEWFTKLKQS